MSQNLSYKIWVTKFELQNLSYRIWVTKGTKGFLHCSFKSGAFYVLKGISQNIFLQISFFLVLTPRTCFGFNDFHIFHINKKWRRPLLYQLFSKSVLMSTLADPNQVNLGFVITNDKASYVAKEDSICLFLIAKKAALNKQWIKTLCLFELQHLSSKIWVTKFE